MKQNQKFIWNNMDTDLPGNKKDKETGKFIERALKKSVYLQQIISDNRALKAIVNAMEPIKVASKVLLTEAGKLGEEMYVCAEGLLEMYDGQNGTHIKTIGSGEVFGELAFICFTKRKTTVRAKIPCKIWVLHHKNYVKIIKMFYTFTDEDYITFLKTIPVLRLLTNENILNIRKLVRVECYLPNSDIIRQGEEGNDFFILTGGTALVRITSSDGREKLLDQLQKGDFFGEGAILGNCKRNATVTAEAPGVECILLDKLLFSQFSDVKLVQTAAMKREEMMKNIVENDIEYHFIRLEDLEVKDIISNCSFGRIELVQYKPYPDLLFALKILKKAYVIQNDFILNALNEKEILMSCKNPFIIRLYKTFKDDKHLYYLQQACLGGDLQHLLKQRNNVDDNMAKFIAACVIEALDYLHSNSIVYGNLETKNLVFDTKGYIKLVSFGMAKRISTTSSSFTDSESNTSDEENPNPSTDYWLLGCLIYEMLVGFPPFPGETEENDISKCDQGNVNFPSYVTKSAKSVIKKLWKQKGCKSSEEHSFMAVAIREKRWFLHFSWSELRNETLPAPYIPKLQYSTDLSNFAKTKKDKELPPDCYGEWDKNF